MATVSIAPGTYTRRFQIRGEKWVMTWRVNGAGAAQIDEGHLWGFLFHLRDSGLNGKEIEEKDGAAGPAKAAAAGKVTSFAALDHAGKVASFKADSPYTVNPWESPDLARVEFIAWEKA